MMSKPKKHRGKKRWKDLTPRARLGVMVTGALELALLVAAQRDISRRPAEQIRGSKLLWRAVSLVNFVGPGSYFIFGRRRAAAGP